MNAIHRGHESGCPLEWLLVGVNWIVDPQVVAAAVNTVLLTTLAVEYLAKPWLEARKDRILDERRRRQLRGYLGDFALSRAILEGFLRELDATPTVNLAKWTTRSSVKEDQPQPRPAF